MAGPAGLTAEPGGRATILDVAAAAGVSRQTVTRAMNGMAGISAETKERVLAAAEALGYRPSRFGRGLVLGGERQLGLVVDDLRNPYSPELASAVVRHAAAKGWNVMLADLSATADPGAMVASLGSQTDAVIGYLGDRAPEWIEVLGSARVVELDPSGEVARAAVRLDPGPAIEGLVAHLAAAGVRAPVVIDALDAASRRAEAMRAAFARLGIGCEIVPATASTAEAAGGLAESLLGRQRRPDALLAFNDVMALGVLAACRRSRVDVPGDVRVAGVDGLSIGTLVAPTLTTLAVDFDALAEAALALVEDPDRTAQRSLHHHLVLRESA